MIKISNLSKAFDGTKVLDNIDIEIKKGEIVAIIGPSGTGKSTLLRCLNFLETPDTGDFTVGELKINVQTIKAAQITQLRKQFAFVFQNYALFANLNARDNIAEALQTVYKQDKQGAHSKAMQILKDIGLENKALSFPSQLSGGQQQRIGIGRAMAYPSQAILFDEPTSALDPQWVDEVLGLIKKLANQQQTMLIVTHEMEFARDVADRIIFMSEGRIVEQGSPEQLFTNPKDPRTQQFLARATKNQTR
ncbi:amino acid ABC transporter ATP-binding protein [Alginatibacterium sediminis]|uniref:Amino acid ABC transporter ATP-binding protein n=1 Tax=Alginatibacterium sediminis TaxID=2164068 RepID=A0A420ENE2_9ALTE|nr:amino acid ABC transporter ATP-binding protein [Alginatibacterium sediminis]RKF22255.1 amino acid ABC transporter ATP-binding protein [Alginatibacterium sediminis]